MELVAQGMGVLLNRHWQVYGVVPPVTHTWFLTVAPILTECQKLVGPLVMVGSWAWRLPQPSASRHQALQMCQTQRAIEQVGFMGGLGFAREPCPTGIATLAATRIGAADGGGDQGMIPFINLVLRETGGKVTGILAPFP